ncbi:SMI1/KNR4 family protein [Streptomyces sp. NPDC002513]
MGSGPDPYSRLGAFEARLGTTLPGDYKRLAEVFGHGAFDGFLQLSVPDAPFKSADIVRPVQAEPLPPFTH